MLRKKKQWNHIKCSLKPQKVEKVEDKNRKKEQGYQTEKVSNMVDINLTVSVIMRIISSLIQIS